MARARARERIDHGIAMTDRARAREWKLEFGKWKSETRSGMAPIGTVVIAILV